jgi:hypothetical protein
MGSPMIEIAYLEELARDRVYGFAPRRCGLRGATGYAAARVSCARVEGQSWGAASGGRVRRVLRKVPLRVRYRPGDVRPFSARRFDCSIIITDRHGEMASHADSCPGRHW